MVKGENEWTVCYGIFKNTGNVHRNVKPLRYPKFKFF